MAVFLFMVFCLIVYFGFVFIKGAFEEDDPEFLKRNPPTTGVGRFVVFIFGLIILFIAWLFYMIATGQI